ncbi:hypothetical protein LJC55_03410 [Eubacteriales bacterium OttesenSCG-928-N14]|nr:hypothetical protein [Eubacteriales bacterium OttesenSCG-928-N14]
MEKQHSDELHAQLSATETALIRAEQKEKQAQQLVEELDAKLAKLWKFSPKNLFSNQEQRRREEEANTRDALRSLRAAQEEVSQLKQQQRSLMEQLARCQAEEKQVAAQPQDTTEQAQPQDAKNEPTPAAAQAPTQSMECTKPLLPQQRQEALSVAIAQAKQLRKKMIVVQNKLKNNGSMMPREVTEQERIAMKKEHNEYLDRSLVDWVISDLILSNRHLSTPQYQLGYATSLKASNFCMESAADMDAFHLALGDVPLQIEDQRQEQTVRCTICDYFIDRCARDLATFPIIRMDDCQVMYARVLGNVQDVLRMLEYAWQNPQLQLLDAQTLYAIKMQ